MGADNLARWNTAQEVVFDLRDQRADPFAPANRVPPLKSEGETDVINLHNVGPFALMEERVEAEEKAFTCGVFVEVSELEWVRHPVLPAWPRGAKDLLIEKGAERVTRLD